MSAGQEGPGPGALERQRARRRGLLALVVVTSIWGSTFVVIKETVIGLLPGSLILSRFALAGLVLSPLFLRYARDRSVWRTGLELGALNWLGYTCQATGLTYTTASRSAFITAISVVLVPALAGLTGRRIPHRVALAAVMALAGVAMLSWDGQPPNRGDALTLGTTLTYAAYVLRLEQAARRFDTRALTLTQIWGVVPFAALWAVFEAGRASGATAGMERLAALPRHWLAVPPEAWQGVIYLALAATALTTALQTYGQRRVDASEAALVYTCEPVWAALFAAWVLGERLGPMGWLGGLTIILATLIGQWRAGERS